MWSKSIKLLAPDIILRMMIWPIYLICSEVTTMSDVTEILIQFDSHLKRLITYNG